MNPILLLVVYAGICTIGVLGTSKPGGTVVCTDTNYTPEFTYTPPNNNEITNVDWKVQIGNDANLNACKGSVTGAAINTLSTISTIGATAFQTCGGSALTDNDGSTGNGDDKIEFTASATVEVELTFRTKIKRQEKYTVAISCTIVRKVTEGSASSWTVNTASIQAVSSDAVTNTIAFPISVDFYDDDYINQASTATVTMGNDLYIVVKETNPSNVFKFKTNKCWFNLATTGNANGLDGTEDTFFDNGCPKDKNPENNDYTEKQDADEYFRMKVKAFFFSGQEGTGIKVFCEVYICLTADADPLCVQQVRGSSGCAMDGAKRRKKRAISHRERRSPRHMRQPKFRRERWFTAKSIDERSISDDEDFQIEKRVIESKTMVLLDRNDVIVPRCREGRVFDRVTKECSNENILQISGLYLDLPWNSEYANTSSPAFKNFALEKEYQIYVLMQMKDAGTQIRGVKVVGAEQGSVILTMQVKYAPTTTASAAFAGFVQAVQTADTTRAANILNIRQEKVIEYREVKQGSSETLNVQNLILIAVVIVLAIVVTASLVGAWKFRGSRRSANSEVPAVKGQDNKGQDNIETTA